MPLPTTMKAVVMKRRGEAIDALVVHTDWPLPVRKPNQVLIEAAATSGNTGEWKMRSGFAPIPLKLPKILGEDVAGVIVDAPQGSKFKRGDRVFAGTGQILKSGDAGGTHAEFVATDEDTVCLIPPGVSFLEAAAVPVAGTTAWQALEPGMPLQGKRVLIHGGAGGVGGFAIQIAKAQGAHVTTTCRTANVAWVMDTLGADVAIDYTMGPWAKTPIIRKGEKFDHIVDTIGGSYESDSLKLVKRGGMLVSLGASGPHATHVSVLGILVMLLTAFTRTLLGKLHLGPKYRFLITESKASKGLEQIAELMAQGKLKVHFDKVFTLDQMVAVHEHLEGKHTRGKVGVRIKDME
ncbi:hypothetical protein D9Q98_009592 [Chlorella vulgaris]|uniref:Enoyl reductase (ER) domain-containing protein n=1 Tax=Chlorella vulgaris TaxID=3077 RepID=A0A9D4TFI4_CHLVU|nr:hypothetical protein D9Q98_009592 [Chlorella vulgaris]